MQQGHNNHNLKPEVRNDVYCFMYPEDYPLPEITNATPTAAQLSEEDELEKD